MADNEPRDEHAARRDRKRRLAMPLHGKGYTKLVVYMIRKRAKEAADAG